MEQLELFPPTSLDKFRAFAGTTMPTLECLDERTKAILERLDSFETKLFNQHQQLIATLDRREVLLTETLNRVEQGSVQRWQATNKRIDKIDEEVKIIDGKVNDINLRIADELGQKKVSLWVGRIIGIALWTMLGVVGNMIWVDYTTHRMEQRHDR